MWRQWTAFIADCTEPLKLILGNPNPEVVFSALDLFDAATESQVISVTSTGPETDKWFVEHRYLEGGRRARAILTSLLFEYLKSGHLNDNRSESRPRRQYLADLLSTYSRGDVVITFNWDVLVERCLAEQGRWTPSDGYGIHVDLLRNDRPLLGLPQSSEITVLKLHGSMGWYQHARFPYGLLFDGPGVFADLGFAVDNHPAHSSNADPNITIEEYKERFANFYLQHPLFLYPSYAKRLVTPEFQSIWVEAGRVVAVASEVDVYGYSLPDADTAVRVLLSPLRARLDEKQVAVRIHDPARQTHRRWYRFLGELDQHEESLGAAR